VSGSRFGAGEGN